MNLKEFNDELNRKITACNTLINVICDESDPVLKVSQAIDSTINKYTWNTLTGLSGKEIPQKQEPGIFSLFQVIPELPEESVIILEDMHLFWQGRDPMIIGALKTLSRHCGAHAKTIIFTGVNSQLPPELKDSIITIEYPRPDKLARREFILQKTKDITGLTTVDKRNIADRCAGLTESQIISVIGEILVTPDALEKFEANAEEVYRIVQKAQSELLKKTVALEIYRPEDLPEVGGYEVTKAAIKRMKNILNCDEDKYPRVKKLSKRLSWMLIGTPGTGKSLMAKNIARMLNTDLYKCDMGALFGPFLGETEERARKLFSTLNTLENVVIWLDEFEKMLPNSTNDSGTSTRIAGMFFTWMQERTSDVFVIATANDITNMPPELLRKGRFDEIFFFDLPSLDERKEIWRIHTKRMDPDVKFDLTKLADESVEFTGAEIEAIVKEAYSLVFYADKNKPMTTKDILSVLNHTKPQAKSVHSRLTEMRNRIGQDYKSAS